MGEPRGITVWTGTAFDCLINKIALLHSRFSDGTFGVCNDGAIVARSLSVEDSSYISQLNVTITPEIAGKTIVCVHNNLSDIIIQVSDVTPSTGSFHLALILFC